MRHEFLILSSSMLAVLFLFIRAVKYLKMLKNIDFSKYDCTKADTRKKMWLLPMGHFMSIYKQVLEFNSDGTAKISEFRNLYEHWPTPRFLNEEYKRGGSVLYDNLKTEIEIAKSSRNFAVKITQWIQDTYNPHTLKRFGKMISKHERLKLKILNVIFTNLLS